MFHLHTIGGRVYNLIAPSMDLRAQWVAFITQSLQGSGQDQQQQLQQQQAQQEPQEVQPPKSYEELFEDYLMLRREYNSLLKSTKEIDEERSVASENLARERIKCGELQHQVHLMECELDSLRILLDTVKAQIESLTQEREDHIVRIRRGLVNEASSEDAYNDLKKRAEIALSDMEGTSAPHKLIERMELFGVNCFAVPLHHIRAVDQKRELLWSAQRTRSPNIVMYVVLFLESSFAQPAFLNLLSSSQTSPNTIALYERHLRKSGQRVKLRELHAYLHRVRIIPPRDYALHLLQAFISPASERRKVAIWEQIIKLDLSDEPLLLFALQHFKRALPVSYLVSIGDPSVAISSPSPPPTPISLPLPEPLPQNLLPTPPPPKKNGFQFWKK